jgi:hypothetical protein
MTKQTLLPMGGIANGPHWHFLRQRHRISPEPAQNRGMALFPRNINGLLADMDQAA